jgi:nucleoprotein TPR
LGEQRVEYERQKSETIQLSHQLSIVLSERDANLQYARDTEHKFATTQKENDLLESQLKDLGRQVQALLREISIHHNPSLISLEQEDDPPDTSEGIDALISNQLVVFKHLPSFQEQYTKHLKVIRDLGDKLERVTREQYEEQNRLENQALEEAGAAIAALQEELENQKKTHDIQIRGFVQERDMYKARLATQSQGRSVYGSGMNGHIDPPAGDAEYESLLADLQRNFDVYRTEIGIDMAKLRDELQDAQRETAQLHAALAKANAKVEFHNGAVTCIQA